MRKAQASPAYLGMCAAFVHMLALMRLAAAQVAPGPGSGVPAWAGAGSRGSDSVITLVATGDQLEAAIERGDAHIEIISHLDLSQARRRPGSYNHEVFWPRPSTQTIRVRSSRLEIPL